MLTTSFILATHNRRESILHTLAVLHTAAARSSPSEILLVDNASLDGTPDAIRQQFPNVRLFPERLNRGPCAKNVAIPHARGQYIVFLDDDSYPQPNCIDRMVREFQSDPLLGAAVFGVDLPNGQSECSAYPEVFAGCGVGLRAAALTQVGGLPDDFFMQAEEYDLALRLLHAGWLIRRFEHVRVTHHKTPTARFPGRVMRLDVRNNLTLIGRYFPDEWVAPYAFDWINRYRMIARVHGRTPEFLAGLAEGLARLTLARDRRPISAAAFETFAKVAQIDKLLRTGPNAQRLLFIDLGKNILPYWHAAIRNGMKVVAIADARLGGHGFKYRGIPIIRDADAAKLDFNDVVVSNLSPVHASQRAAFWRTQTDRPVIDFFASAPLFLPQPHAFPMAG